jgi:type I restriction enzyme M protein
MFEQTFKNIDDILRKAGGSQTELDYVEQTSWILFLKYLDDLEKDKAVAAKLRGEEYTPIIAPEYQWSNWAMPVDANGKLDYNKALTGDDLNDFVNLKLFPYLKNFKTIAQSSDTIEYKIGEIFSELKNKIASGYGLREIIELIGKLRFRTHAEKHEMSHLYEAKIKNMGNAGRNGGEYYTPRPLITTIIKVVDPKIGQTIYDGAVGSAGFLVEAFEYLIKAPSTSSGQDSSTGSGNNLSSNDWETLQKHTFYGKEKGSLAYIIAIMNMILHGIEAPNIIHTNTLTENLADIQEKDRYDIVLANPPFGGKERAEVQQNFPIKTGETASLFLQHFIKILKAGGKAGIVIKNTFLSNGGAGSADARLRQQLLENNNLHTILDCPGGVFTAGVKTVILFFTKGEPTQKVWYYQLNLNRNLGKTNPLNEQDLAEFVELQKLALSGAEGAGNSENSWSINIADIDPNTFDLSVKNPNKKAEAPLRDPQDILTEIQTLDSQSQEILQGIEKLL